ncbi:hypothetical protein SLEP1_g30864 [Rubroshorea leprosula]|uniref:EngB-type G domain-containing protein n=1 Tax=Rubroshorea leprosula TaxID=152421 RepID=A0AAV5K9H2_9ROSI|nr:hypothetical protein SLEP1_g30864 [Rubroshorea leprosula]
MSEEAKFRQKLDKKLKVAIGKSKNSKQGIEKDYLSVLNGKPHKIQNGDKRNSKSSSECKTVSDRRRKRVFAAMDGSAHDATGAPYRKALSSRKGQDQRKRNDKSIRSMWVSNGPEDIGSTNKATSLKLKNVVKSTQESHGKLRTNSKQLYKTDVGAKGSLKKHVKNISNSRKRMDQSPNASPLLSAKKTLVGDSEILDDQPKKRKRVIRLDPYDISNKRLDDGMSINENTKEKKNDLEKDAEISKNAQFRAIQPSPSILSFVEDNLLGRRRSIELQRAGYNTELYAPLDNVAFSTSSERERIEENIFRNKLTFFAAAKVSSSFPPPDIPEIAFAGRSNVGKSSLLNALTRQWGVVRTSDKPGHTQTINFFKLGSKLCPVDLPGYGFAYAKEEVKEAWEELVKEYVSTRVGLKRVCLLIDTKWGMKPRDHELIDLMERYQTKYQIVLTKTDMVFPIDVARRATQIEENLKANKSVVQPVMMVSSKSGAGIQSLRTVLAKIARFAKL